MLILDQPPKLILPPWREAKPAIIRPMDDSLIEARKRFDFASALPGIGGAISAGGKPPANLTYRGSYSETTNAANMTKTGAAIGTASPTRYVIVPLSYYGGSGVPSTCTIGGITANRILSAASASNGAFMANVPTGTSVTIAITGTGGNADVRILGWYTFDNGTNDVAAVDSGTGTSSYSVLAPASSAIVALFRSVSVFSATWTNLTEDLDTGSIASAELSLASREQTTAPFSGTISCSSSFSYVTVW